MSQKIADIIIEEDCANMTIEVLEDLWEDYRNDLEEGNENKEETKHLMIALQKLIDKRKKHRLHGRRGMINRKNFTEKYIEKHGQE